MNTNPVLIFCAIFLSGLASAQYEVRNCPPEDSTFELVTGWMYSAPSDIVETRAGTLQLAECIEACNANASCLAVNFETGLCVLFSSQVQENTELLIKSQFPVFTMYAQKQCLPSARSCHRPWAFELVTGSHIIDGAKKQMELPSRAACMDACIQERSFICRSAWWDKRNQVCSMSELDRMSVEKMGRVGRAQNMEYMESQCVQEPRRMCDFRRIQHRLLKTVDSLHEGVDSLDKCRELCLNAPFRCHTFDFEGVCRLSHHAASTLAHVQEPYLHMNGSTSYERGACYDVNLDCHATHLVAKLSTNKMFDGKVYARQRPNSCVKDIKNSMNFEVMMEYSDPACAVKKEEAGRFSTELVLQHHDQIMTSGDMGFALRCSFHLENQSVAHGIELQVNGQIQSMASESAVVPSPNVSMRITDRLGADIHTAQVGDPLSLRFEIADLGSPYEIFVRELLAMDGSDGAEIVLIDDRGCPTDPSIMGPVTQVNSDGKTLHAFFEAFKFPTSEVVQFQALVTPCLPSCQPVDCSLPSDPSLGGTFQAQSYGRRRRRRSPPHLNETVENLLLINSIRIADRIKFDDQGRPLNVQPSSEDLYMELEENAAAQMDGNNGSSYSGQCVNLLGFLVAVLLLVVLQVAIIAAWLYLMRRRSGHGLPKKQQQFVYHPQEYLNAPYDMPPPFSRLS